MATGDREFGVTLEGVLCTECGLVFGVPREYFDARVADRRPMSCMNGHQVAIGVPAGVDKLVQALEAKIVELETARQVETRLAFQLDAEVRELRRSLVNALVGNTTVEDRS
jgi:hypothetical protein